MKKRTIAVMAIVLLLILGSTVWAFRARSNYQINKVRELQKELFAPGKPPQPEQIERFQTEMDRLSPSQREEIGRRSLDDMRRQMESTIDRFFELPKEKQGEFLDQQIKEFDDATKRMASGPPKGQAPQGGAAGQAGSGARPKITAETRQQWRNNFLDHTTPQQRAKGAAFFAALAKRRQQLGLPAFPQPPGPPRR